jgi:hypothetical protein
MSEHKYVGRVCMVKINESEFPYCECVLGAV